ncbi:unnamed protein product [Kuraishia capsulata CBS 1993]|uniref:HORMA domain-containing protein n=1 Tax=Kuraishia capsulata CBS 1993 TaxID=1382522 RepID=W6MVP2_9ASCO|nr:uncharacterized protein KUCA_T00006027001 [Kuraishia capsulata CBS 1993]CDK30032.1 unnamed protein product [Kuraishia capsulata CBS 1993]
MDSTRNSPNVVELRGSSRIVSDFFGKLQDPMGPFWIQSITDFFSEYSIHSILYQRGIYPAEDFQVRKKYGLNMMVSINEEVNAYVKKIMSQLQKWIKSGGLSKLVIVISSKDSGKVVERWQFDVKIAEKQETSHDQEEPRPKLKEEVQREIQTVIRQITAAVTFLPQLDNGDHSFNVLVYTDGESVVPNEWIDSDPKDVEGDNVENVNFRNFSTDKHKVGALVSYSLT